MIQDFLFLLSTYTQHQVCKYLETRPIEVSWRQHMCNWLHTGYLCRPEWQILFICVYLAVIQKRPQSKLGPVRDMERRRDEEQWNNTATQIQQPTHKPNQSTESTGGSIVSECRLRKWSWTGSYDCFLKPLTSSHLRKQCIPWSDATFCGVWSGLHFLSMY